MRYRLTTVSLLALLVLAPEAVVLRAQTSADVFNPDTLQEIRLLINTKDLQQLRDFYYVNTIYPADLVWRNVRVRNVAVRTHGVASRNPIKLGLTIDIDKYTTGQTFVGLKGLSLDNLWTDPSMMHDFLAMRFFERMGQPAPRESFARLYINNVFQGLYTVIEQVDPDFLMRTLNENAGYLFEYRRQFAWFGEYLGDDPLTYRPIFEARTRQLEPDGILWGPFRDLFRELNDVNDAVWRDRVEQLIDLPAFVAHVAIESFLVENDGVIGPAGMNNFFVYRPAGTTRHRWLVWDKDSTFFPDGLAYSVFERMDTNVLTRRALSYPDLRSVFLKVAEDCARSAAQDGWLAAEVDRVAALITDTAHGDSLKQYSNVDFDQHVELLRQFARTRPDIVLQELASLRR